MLSTAAGKKVWSNIMEILDEKDGVDTELLVYAMTLINKVRGHVHPNAAGHYTLSSVLYLLHLSATVSVSC